MATRIKLADRMLPNYSWAEECMNMVTHIVGGGLGSQLQFFSILLYGYRGLIFIRNMV